MATTSSTAWALALGALSLAAGGTRGGPTEVPQRSEWKEFVEFVCLDCHGGRDPEGGIDLGSALADPGGHRESWERAYRAVQGRMMPPATGTLGAGLGEEERAEWIEGLLPFLGVDEEDPGEVTVRRLTRSQLKGVLRDLLGVTVDVERFLPRDASGYGFDTTGDTLFVTPYYFEVWFEVVDAALRTVREDEGKMAALYDPARGVGEQLTEFVGRALRRPATEQEIASRVALVEAEVESGVAPAAAYAEGLRATLLSPTFLFRAETATDPEAQHSRVDDFTLASRLSLWLWGTLPDAGLRAHAAAGDLHEPEVLVSEVERMLADPSSAWLARDFAMQWLGASELVDVSPDVRRFGSFNERLRRAMGDEVLAFFGDLVAKDRSVLECIDSEHAFLNGRLAGHYGVEGVDGNRVRRVAVADRRRGGVLGMGAVLTVTSEALRTSPVKRGQWVLDRLLRSPSPPPPPGVGSLPEDDVEVEGLTFRDRLVRHRAEPACASCHSRMDPLGFALEGLDGIGRIREPAEGAEPIDDSAVLDGGQVIQGVEGLKDALLQEPERFVRAFTEHLFVYAIGRPPGLSDHTALDGVVRRARGDGYRFSSIVQGIAATPAFQRRRSSGASGTLQPSQGASSR